MLTRNNYETWFIDYHDGALSKAQEAELFAFLEKNTDLKAEFEFFNSVSLEPEEITFSGKESLKKSLIDRTNFENWFVAYVENDLSESDRKLVEEFLKANPALQKELELIIKTKSIPDYTIIFENKSSLRRGAKVISFSRTVTRSLSIAASIVLIAVAYYFIQVRGRQKEEFAHEESTEKSAVPSQVIPEGSEKNLADHRDVEAQTSDPQSGEPQSGEPQSGEPQSGEPQNGEPQSGERKSDETKSGERKKNVRPQMHRSAPVQNLAHNDQGTISPKSDNLKKEQPAPQPQLANQPPVNNQTPVQSPVNQIQQNLANNPIGNSPGTSPTKVLKPTAAELATVFSAEELKELGVEQGSSPANSKPKSIPVMQYAAKEVKAITDKSEITLKKDQNIVTDATTYALNIGKNFSVSHTSVK